MGIHKYKGSKQHTFRERNEKCSWCSGYAETGYIIHFNTKKYGVHIIETDYCSPKCFSEDKRFEDDYFENMVLRFIQSGGIKDFDTQRKKKSENWELEQLIRDNESNRIKKKQKINKIIFWTIMYGIMILFFIWILSYQ